MLIDLYKHLRFAPLEEYQYVGLGSVAFVDFRMVHRSLGIDTLLSIEGTDDPLEQARFVRNKPYDQIDLRFGHSSQVLPYIDFQRHSLVWLDYDNTARRSMVNDLATVAAKAKSGTFLALTFTNSFPTEGKAAVTALAHLKEGFPEFVPDDAQPLAYQGPRYAEFVRSVFGALLDTALADADAGVPDPLDRRYAFQVCYFKYKDGMQMATIGWIVVSERDIPTFELCRLEALPFYRSGKRAFTINIPKVTPLEIREMERRLPSPETSDDLNWIPEDERRSFAQTYRYLPSFASVEAI
jgi:hypothetical protein